MPRLASNAIGVGRERHCLPQPGLAYRNREQCVFVVLTVSVTRKQWHTILMCSFND